MDASIPQHLAVRRISNHVTKCKIYEPMKKTALLVVLPLVWAAAGYGAGNPPGKLASAGEEKRLQETYSAYRGVDPDYRHAGEAAIERWMDWKWGLRIHW